MIRKLGRAQKTKSPIQYDNKSKIDCVGKRESMRSLRRK